MVFEQYASGGRLRGVFQGLRGYGIIEFLLPFLLMFILFYGVLQKAMIFKTKKKVGNADVEVGDKKVNGPLALIMSALITAPSVLNMYPPGMDPVALIYLFLPETVVLIAALFLIVMLLGLAGAGIPSSLQLLIGGIAAVMLVFVFGLNLFPALFPWFDFLRDPTIQALIIILLTLILIVYFVFKEPGTAKGYDTVHTWLGRPPKGAAGRGTT